MPNTQEINILYLHKTLGKLKCHLVFPPAPPPSPWHVGLWEWDTYVDAPRIWLGQRSLEKTACSASHSWYPNLWVLIIPVNTTHVCVCIHTQTVMQVLTSSTIASLASATLFSSSSTFFSELSLSIFYLLSFSFSPCLQWKTNTSLQSSESKEMLQWSTVFSSDVSPRNTDTTD